METELTEEQSGPTPDERIGIAGDEIETALCFFKQAPTAHLLNRLQEALGNYHETWVHAKK